MDDNKHIGDLLAEFKAVKERSKGEVLHCKLVFKKKLFRESDEAVTDPMFWQLSYVQVCLFRFCFTSLVWFFFLNRTMNGPVLSSLRKRFPFISSFH